jgi:hypothetical protein
MLKLNRVFNVWYNKIIEELYNSKEFCVYWRGVRK